MLSRSKSLGGSTHLIIYAITAQVGAVPVAGLSVAVKVIALPASTVWT
jgi:hypothetical protein